MSTVANKGYIDDVFYRNFGSTATTKYNIRLLSFAENAEGPMKNTSYIASMKQYEAYIWQNDVLVFLAIPAKRLSDNMLGMYDLVTDTFFTNTGTGKLIGGPAIE